VSTVAEPVGRGSIVAPFVVVGALLTLATTVLLGPSPLHTAPVLAVVMIFTVFHRSLLGWTSLVAALLTVVLFIPMQRFVLPGSLPFELEPYRVLVAFMFTGWVASLLVDSRVALRRTGFEGPLLLLTAGVFGSVVANSTRVQGLETEVAKALTFFASFLLVFYFVVSVVRTRAHVDLLVKVIVACGAVVAGAAVVESRTEYNVFNDIPRLIPLLKLGSLTVAPSEDRGFRAYASAQHPIALGALLIVLLPLSIYLIKRTGQRRWWIGAGVLAMGALATLSRTSVLMLLVVGLVFFFLRPAATKRFLPYLLPGLVAVHLVIPGTIGTLKEAFFPEGGLVAEQTANAGSRGQGRLADIGPALDEFGETPLFGQGYATRRVEFDRQNAQILDNQWLGNLLETGLVGTLGWAWLFLRSIRRFGGHARRDPTADGWLSAALVASVSTFAIGMFTFDAFAFVQVTLMVFILVALGAATTRSPQTAPVPVGPSRLRDGLPAETG
jgi:O-antigen ligase/polysaccharide polymerase Wzy-like membrane protein